MPPARVFVAAALIAIVAAFVYCSGLGVSPVYLTKDEVSYGIQADAIATTGRDAAGHLFPVYFQEPGFTVGRDPLYVYASALVLKFMPLGPEALRVPTTMAALI